MGIEALVQEDHVYQPIMDHQGLVGPKQFYEQGPHVYPMGITSLKEAQNTPTQVSEAETSASLSTFFL